MGLITWFRGVWTGRKHVHLVNYKVHNPATNDTRAYCSCGSWQSDKYDPDNWYGKDDEIYAISD